MNAVPIAHRSVRARRMRKKYHNAHGKTRRNSRRIATESGENTMGMTMTQRIIAAHCGLASVTAGQLVEAELDLVLGNDITTPVAVDAMEKAGAKGVFDSSKIALVLDHFCPNKDIKAARQATVVRDFARKYAIEHFYDVGAMGIEHCLLPEQGLVAPGACVIGADSHTCTYGALGAFSTGVGSTDMAAGMMTGKTWLRVPAAICFDLRGSLRGEACGKDVILHIIGSIGVEGARYMSMEFRGEGVASLSMDDRFTIANMAVEAGAKNCVFPVDEKTREYCEGRLRWQAREFAADADAEYERVIEIDLDRIEPVVALPSSPGNVKRVSEIGKGELPIQQAVIGSCTNGRLSDLRAAAEILRGKRVAEDVRCIVIPGTQQIWREAMNEGLFEIFIDAGAIVSTPTCGPCLGGYMGILDDGERAISTTNRNFVGRMGHKGSEVVLASPATAARSAIAGYVTGE